jgi:hypothetical protein
MVAGLIVTVADPDLWGHVRFGLDILQHGIQRSGLDPYAFTADRPFVYHEWLGGTIMAVAFRLGGAPGLQLLKAALVAAVFGLVWLHVRRARDDWRWAAMALTAMAVYPSAIVVRPQLWTLIGLLLVTAVLRRPSDRALLWLPPIFGVWANLHGGWMVGGALVAIETGFGWLRRDARRWRLLVAGAASLAATLVTPYGFDLWQFLAETVRLGRTDISEWQPVWRIGGAVAALWLATTGGITYHLRRCGWPSPSATAGIAILAFAAWQVNRLVPLYAVVTVVSLAPQWPPAIASRRDIGRALVEGVAVAAAVIVMFFIGSVAPCIALGRDQIPPDTLAAESLRGARGRLVTFFDWGEYALWHFGPGLQVSIDGRRETVYSAETQRIQLGVATGTREGLHALAQMQPQFVWLPAWSPARRWLLEHGYRLDVKTTRSFVAVRGDVPPLSAWQGRSSGCFPGP